jgi:hypothetical protein
MISDLYDAGYAVGRAEILKEIERMVQERLMLPMVTRLEARLQIVEARLAVLEDTHPSMDHKP